MSADESPERTVFDTVVINYFLAVGQIETLIGLCGHLLVPRAVFDPDEPDDLREEAMSELRRGRHLHRRRASGPLRRVAGRHEGTRVRTYRWARAW